MEEEGSYSYDEKCAVCGEDATKYIGGKAVLPICDNPVCYEVRIEEVNKFIKQLNNEELEQKGLEE